MTWLLCLHCFCCLLLINMSGALQIVQSPRFLGLRPGRDAKIWCLLKKQLNIEERKVVTWMRLSNFNDSREAGQNVASGRRVEILPGNFSSSLLHITRLQEDDSGVYFCRVDTRWGPGAELRVARSVNAQQRSYRSKVKDGLIILQSLLLAACVAALLLRKRTLLEQSDSVYEEPEMDHIYEGLTIETCGGGGLYEELSHYTQPQTTEAPWQ